VAIPGFPVAIVAVERKIGVVTRGSLAAVDRLYFVGFESVRTPGRFLTLEISELIDLCLLN
jgi:hypothetical protein